MNTIRSQKASLIPRLVIVIFLQTCQAVHSWSPPSPSPSSSSTWTSVMSKRKQGDRRIRRIPSRFIENQNDKGAAASLSSLASEKISSGFLHGTEIEEDSSTRRRRRPFLAVITESDACDSDKRLESTLRALESAVSTRQVDLVSIRVGPRPSSSRPAGATTDDDDTSSSNNNNDDDKASRVAHLAYCLSEWSKEFDCCVVMSSDWIVSSLSSSLLNDMEGDDLTVASEVQHNEVLSSLLLSIHGIHVKESHQCYIPLFRALFEQSHRARDDDDDGKPPCCVIGTSAHDVDSAVQAYRTYQPDYFFVGTCFPTLSHPEKAVATDLEGPALPGQVAQALEKEAVFGRRPRIYGIGGLDATNSHIPVVKHGADGVATIRSILQSPDPAQAVQDIKNNMNEE